MWVLLSTRLRRWLLFVVGMPLLGRLLHRVADTLEARQGPTSSAASALRTGGDMLKRGRRGRRRRGWGRRRR